MQGQYGLSESLNQLYVISFSALFTFISQLFQGFRDYYNELFIAFCLSWTVCAAGFEEGFVYVPLANWCRVSESFFL